jgi:hypothetical protein
MADGDDIEAGRTTGANQTTILVGETKGFLEDFNDDVFFVVTRNADDGRRNPSHATDGVYGVGWLAGFGVVGFGGPVQGTGVVGQGGWKRLAKAVAPLSWDEIGGRDKIQDGTVGGIGVHGLGGNQDSLNARPGPGILAQGGKPDTSPTARESFAGPGVVGVAGGVPVPDPLATRNIGVYGEGSTGVFAQGIAIPGLPGETNVGLSAVGSVGVVANGHFAGGRFSGDEVGVEGHGDSGTGGVFESNKAAQVRLTPHEAVEPIPDEPFPVRALNPKGHETVLPANGQAGDLLCTSMKATTGKPVAVLWFCVTSGDTTGPALWRQVLLGPEVRGQG